MTEITIPAVSADPAVMRETETLRRVQTELNQARVKLGNLANGHPPRTQFDKAVDAALGLALPDAGNDADKADLVERVRVLTAAEDKQRKAVRDAESVASTKIAKLVRPQYEALLKKEGVKAVDGVRAFIVKERAFRQSLIDADVNFSAVFRPMGLPTISDENDCDFWRKELHEYYGQ